MKMFKWMPVPMKIAHLVHLTLNLGHKKISTTLNGLTIKSPNGIILTMVLMLEMSISIGRKTRIEP